MKNIGFDAKRIVRNATGLGHYGRTLVNALSEQLPGSCTLNLYAPDPGRDDLHRELAAAPNIVFRYPQGKPSRIRRDLWRTFGIAADLRRDGIELFHGLSGELPIGLRKAGIPGVATIHDLIFIRHPEYYNPIDVAIYKWKFRSVCREATRLIAISQRTKRDIIELGHFPEERIDLVYQSCSTRFKDIASDAKKTEVKARYNLPDHYVLSVGTIEQRKNAGLAIEAMAQMPQNTHLVLVGRKTKYTEKILKKAQKTGVYSRVRVVSGVPDADLPAIYQQAEAFVYPSRYEGFGIPIIEAIQSRLPVVAATGSCLEEAGGPSCYYVGPDDAEAMARAMLHATTFGSERSNRIAAALEYVERFENQDIARQVADVYEKTLL